MPRLRRAKAPIHTVKHIVQFSNASITTGATREMVVIDTVAIGATRSTTADVEEGSVVKAVFVEQWVLGDTSTTSQFTMVILKVPNQSVTPTATQMSNLQSYEGKNNILYLTQGVIGLQNTAQAVPINRGWILIPKGKQRFSLGDRIVVIILAVGQLRNCGVNIFKEYY